MRKKTKGTVYGLIILAFVMTFGILVHSHYKRNEVVATVTYTVGQTSETIVEIKRRLTQWGYFTGEINNVFDQELFNVIMRFQANHGLVPNGIIGEATLAALGVPAGGFTGPVVMEEQIFELGGFIFDERDLQLLAQVINGEARGEPHIGQVAVGAVILNRVKSPLFPNTLEGVVYQLGAFEAVADGQIYLAVEASAINAAYDALRGWDPTGGALYYWNPVTATSKWIWTVPITMQIGNHVFGVGPSR